MNTYTKKAIPAILAILAILIVLPCAAHPHEEPKPENPYNHFRLEGELLGSKVQTFKAPGPEGSPPESVCLLRMKPYFHHAAPEWTEVFVWMQGGGVVECRDWGATRKGAWVVATGYLVSYEISGATVTAIKPTHLSVTDQP